MILICVSRFVLATCSSIETLRAETPEEFYAPKESDKLNASPDDSQLNAIHEATAATGGGGGGATAGAVEAAVGAAEKQLKFRQEIHALALEGGDVARGYCSCDEQWTNSSSPTSTTTSATMSPTLTTTGSANAKSAGGGKVDSGRGSGSGNGNGNGIVRMAAALKQRNAAGARLKQQHHVRFSDEKNFSD